MELLKDNIQGLKSAIQTLRETERLFIRANTLSEQVEKARSDFKQIEEDLEAAKEEKASLKAEKFAMLKEACEPLAEKITALLPRGVAVVRMEEELFIGMIVDPMSPVTPYSGLSGGEKCFFDLALSNALLTRKGQKILVIEAAEEDEVTLAASLATISKTHPEVQVLVLTCHAPNEIPAPWKVVSLP
jgi:chromosome segregation ATPase